MLDYDDVCCHHAGQQVQVTTVPAPSAAAQVQLPQLVQQGSQGQYTAMTTGQLTPVSGQRSQPDASSGQRRQQDVQPSLTQTPVASSGDGISDLGMFVITSAAASVHTYVVHDMLV